jgi:hypothetical protein
MAMANLKWVIWSLLQKLTNGRAWADTNNTDVQVWIDSRQFSFVLGDEFINRLLVKVRLCPMQKRLRRFDRRYSLKSQLILHGLHRREYPTRLKASTEHQSPTAWPSLSVTGAVGCGWACGARVRSQSLRSQSAEPSISE